MVDQIRGRDLRQARIDAGLKQADMEVALGVHHAFLSSIENELEGVMPSPDFARRYLVAVEAAQNAANGNAA